MSAEPLMQMIQGLQVTAILRAGIQLGIFDQIANGKTRASSIAAAIGADERGTRILLDALVALRLLDLDEGYRLTCLADAFLVTSRPSYLGGMVNIMAAPWLWNGFQHLPAAVQRGGTVMDQHAETPEWEFWETFAPSSSGIAIPAAQILTNLLKEWAGQREKLEVLDIACGSGLYSLTLAAEYPLAHATLLDWTNVLERTKDNVERLGLRERVSFIGGDVFTVGLGGPYDLIIASHIFHHFSQQRCLELMRRLASTLKPGGRLVIHDFVAGARPAEDPFPYLFSIIMLTASRDGEAYSLDTYRQLLQEAGFSPPVVHDSQGMASRFLVVGPAELSSSTL
jgi:ubiquinone/menaquinone biosynthesis C-methylase UbiE